MNLTTILILSAAMASPAPTATPVPPTVSDACTINGQMSVLSTINRPTVGFSPCAVQPGKGLIETGYQHSAGGSNLTQLGQGFLRFGAARNVELDVIGPAYDFAPGAAGFADWGLGAKFQVTRTAQTAVGIDLLLTTPSGARAFTAGSATQTLNVNYATSFGKFGIGSTLGAVHANGYVAMLPSLVLTNQFSDRAQWYAEAFAQSKTGIAGPTLFGQDAGFQYMLTSRLEVDIDAGHVTAGAARTNYEGFGFGIAL